LFTDPPGAFLHRQASFIQSFITACPGGDKLVPGKDFDFFAFPTIDATYGNPGLGAADSFVLFKDNENTRALIEFLTQPDTMAGWLKGGGSGIAVNKEFPPADYPDALTRRAAEVLASVDSFRYDASDQMPGDVNQAFWTGTLDFVNDTSKLPDILKTIEDIAKKAYASS
jgi:alpha-glucoside transport system substrate-binding protein